MAMKKSQKKSWEDLFGSEQNDNDEKMDFLNPSQIIDSIPSKLESLKKAFGKKLLYGIETYQKLLRTSKLKGKMKQDLEKALSFLTKLAKSDIKHLLSLQELLVETSLSLYEDDSLERIKAIMEQLNNIITEQAAKLNKINCDIKIETLDEIIKNNQKKHFEKLLPLIKEGDYFQAMVLIIYLNCVYTQNQAENLISLSKKSSKYYPDDASDFLALLELRLLSPQAKIPHTIDYSILQNNKFIQTKGFYIGLEMRDMMGICALMEEKVKFYDIIWDQNLQEKFANTVYNNIDSLINEISQKYPKEFVQHCMGMLKNGD